MTRSGTRTLQRARTTFEYAPPTIWLGAIVLGSTAVSVYAALAVAQPFVFRDELVYSSAAKALVHGAYGESPLSYGAYPLLLAPFYALFADVEHAYTAIKIANGAVFSLAACPAYLIARRVARPVLALGAAVLTVALPARLYSALVLAESASFLLFVATALSLIWLLERPSMRRQLVVFGLAALAVAVRRQNIALFAAIPLSIAIDAVAADRSIRAGWARIRRDFVLTGFVVALGACAAVAWSVLSGRGANSLLGPYGALARDYDLAGVGYWLRAHVADLGLMFGVIPIAALPLALRQGFRRDAAPPTRAVCSVTSATLAALLFEVAAFSSTPYGLRLIHERYLFYVGPLIFATFVLWIERPRTSNTGRFVAVAATVLLPFLLPRSGLENNGVDAPVLFALGLHPGHASAGGRHVFDEPTFVYVGVLLSAYLGACLVLARPRARPALLLLCAAFFFVVDIRLHQTATRSANILRARAVGAARDAHANWIDRVLGRNTPVTVLYVAPASTCRHPEVARARVAAIYYRTEFFNSHIVRVLTIGRPAPDAGVPESRLQLRPRDSDLRQVTTPAHMTYVVADRRIALAGQVIAQDAPTGLALWAVRGAGRPRSPSTLHELTSAVCGR